MRKILPLAPWGCNSNRRGGVETSCFFFAVWEQFNRTVHEEELFTSPHTKHVGETWNAMWAKWEKQFIETQIVAHVVGKVGAPRKM